MKFTAFLLSVLLLTPFAYAHVNGTTPSIYTTNPVLNTTVIKDSNFNITWIQTDANVTTIDSISLMAGSASELTLILFNILPSAVPSNTLFYNWYVPANLTTRQDYALVFRGNDTVTSYSTYFTITDKQ